LEVNNFQRALAFNPTNSKYYGGLAEVLGKHTKVGSSRPEIEKLLQQAIFYAPSNWGYRLRLANYYLEEQQVDALRIVPLALRELTAAVSLFPESGWLNFRLASVLAWAEKYYSPLIPTDLRTSSQLYYDKAVKLQPELARLVQ
jgi:tetratricopeptide (TPR) repeat protein